LAEQQPPDTNRFDDQPDKMAAAVIVIGLTFVVPVIVAIVMFVVFFLMG